MNARSDFPHFDPANWAESYASEIIASGEVFGVRNSQNGENGNLLFSVGTGSADDVQKVFWMKDASGTSAPWEANFYSSMYYDLASSATWQTVQFVIGPSYQACYINHALVCWTRFDLSISASKVYPELRGGAHVEYGSVKIYAGDASGTPVNGRLCFQEEFAQKSPDKNGLWRLDGERWVNESAQVPTGEGGCWLNSDFENSVRSSFNHPRGGPFDSVDVNWSDDLSLSVRLRWPNGFGNDLTANQDLFGLASASGALTGSLFVGTAVAPRA